MNFTRQQTASIVTQATHMHACGGSWESVAATLGVTRHWLDYWRNKTSTPRAVATRAELRFHTLRLGSRCRVARLYGVSPGAVYSALPVTDFDRYLRGMAVVIGGVLVKRCADCLVARKLEDYWANPSSKSGCRQTCSHCRKR